MDCRCRKCKNACTNVPGWFLPGEAEKAAELLGLSMQDFFRQYLGVNWWEGTKETEYKTVFVLAPAITDMDTGKEYPGNPS